MTQSASRDFESNDQDFFRVYSATGSACWFKFNPNRSVGCCLVEAMPE